MEYEKVIDYINQLICSGELGVGSKLPTERSIAETLGIGRNSTREALSILHGMGMIRSVQGSGNYLTGDAHRSIRQICTMMLALGTITKRDVCEFRRVMEKSACMLLAAKDLEAEDRQKFRGILEDMESAADERQALLDRDFHALLLQATGNPLMTTILDAVSDVYQEWIDIVISRAGADEKAKLHGYHRGIVDGISAGDMEGTVRCVDGHYDLIEKLLVGGQHRGRDLELRGLGHALQLGRGLRVVRDHLLGEGLDLLVRRALHGELARLHLEHVARGGLLHEILCLGRDAEHRVHPGPLSERLGIGRTG